MTIPPEAIDLVIKVVLPAATAVGTYFLRDAIALRMVSGVLSEAEPRFKAFENYQPLRIAEQPPQAVEAIGRFRNAVRDSDTLRAAAGSATISVPDLDDRIFESAEAFAAQINALLRVAEKDSFLAMLKDTMLRDIAIDAVLNQAILEAFPDSTLLADVSASGDFVLGPELAEFLHEIGIIDIAAEFLQVIAQVVSEEVVISVAETLADHDVAIFTLISVARKEAKMIRNGHSSFGESLAYGTLNYGSRLSCGFAGFKAGTAVGLAMPLPFTGPVFGLFGGIGGAIFGRKIFRWMLRKEIEGLKEQYTKALAEAKRILEAHKRNIAKNTRDAAARESAAYIEELRKCPDLRAMDGIKEVALQISHAYCADLARVQSDIDNKRSELVGSIRKPGLWAKVCGADWITPLTLRLSRAVGAKEQTVQRLREQYDRAAATADPVGFILALDKKQHITGCNADVVVKSVPYQVWALIDGYRGAINVWAGRCSDAWQRVHAVADGALRSAHAAFVAEHNLRSTDLERRRSVILHKSTRLQK